MAGWSLCPVTPLADAAPTPRTELPLIEVYHAIRERQIAIGSGSDPGAPSTGVQGYALINSYRTAIEALISSFANSDTVGTNGTKPTKWSKSSLFTHLGISDWTRRPSRAGSATTGALASGDLPYAEHVNEMVAVLLHLEWLCSYMMSVASPDNEYSSAKAGSGNPWDTIWAYLVDEFWQNERPSGYWYYMSTWHWGLKASLYKGSTTDSRGGYISIVSHGAVSRSCALDVVSWKMCIAEIPLWNGTLSKWGGECLFTIADDASLVTTASAEVASPTWYDLDTGKYVSPGTIYGDATYSDLDDLRPDDPPGNDTYCYCGFDSPEVYTCVLPDWEYTA